jgi:hypothetical protein
VMSCTLNAVTYSMPTFCANGATPTYDGDPVSPTLIGCTLNGVAQSVTGGGCNNAGSQPVLNPPYYMANPLYNASPLICVIAETYSSLSQATGGPLGVTSSRVVGGIHTPSAVTQALALGNAIGNYTVPALASGQSCNGHYYGVVNGNVTVSAGQNCVFTSPCEIKGNVTVNGGSFALTCAVDGNVTISGSSAFSLQGASIGNDLHIQMLSAGQLQGVVCGTMIKGNLVVQNNLSPVEVGATNPSACAGNTVGNDLQANNNNAALSIDYNTVGGNLQVQNNTATTDVSRNTVTKNLQCQGNTQGVTDAAGNNKVLQGTAQGQCAASSS